MTEIERKFLVNNTTFKNSALSHSKIRQGFLNTDPERTVRVRIKGDVGYITVKGLSNAQGTTRFEWEKEISKKEADDLLKLCEATLIDKTRYEITIGDHLYEVDVFSGLNKGLIVAEIELGNPDEAFQKPDWLGREVTGDIRYYNSHLSKHPYQTWEI